MSRAITNISCILLMAALIAACGGGGSSSGGNGANGPVVNGYTISGNVLNNTGLALPGVTVALTGTNTITATTDVNGAYTFTGAVNGNYTLTASLSGYTFLPVSIPVVVSNGNVTSQNFVGSATSPNTYTISGLITTSGTYLSGATVSLTGSGSGAITTTTDNINGVYKFTGVPNGNYTLVVSMNGYTFSPTSIPVTVNNGNMVNQNFVAYLYSQTPYVISGTLSNSAGSALSGATVTLSGSTTKTTTTDTNGSYSFAGVSNGGYTLTAALSGYTFSPTSIPVTVNNGNVNGQNLVGTATSPSTYSISGTVTAGLGGATVTLTGTSTNTSITEWTGNYTFTGVANGNYTLNIYMGGYTFNPASISVTVNSGNVTGQNFVGTPNIVSGRVTGSGGTGAYNIPLTLLAGHSYTTTTNQTGYFTFSNVQNGNYTLAVTPLTGYTLSPTSIPVSIVNSGSVTGLSFSYVSSIPLYTISGLVAGSNHLVIPGATVSISVVTGGIIGGTGQATTDSNGAYTLTGIESGTYILNVRTVGGTFNPYHITVTGNMTGVILTGI